MLASYESGGSSVSMILYLAILVFSVVCSWIVFSKAGQPGWAALIPIYNMYILFKIAWGNGWKMFLMLIPIYNLILSIQTSMKLAAAFGKSGGFAVGLIFLPHIFMAILAFGDARYGGGAAQSGPRLQQAEPWTQPQNAQDPWNQPRKPEADPTCPYCGQRVAPGTRFCPSCGAPLENKNN